MAASEEGTPATETRRPCVRCGDFVAGSILCPGCLEGARTTGEHVWVRPPWSIVLIQLTPTFLVAAVGFLVGAGLGLGVSLTGPANTTSTRLLLAFLCGLGAALVAGSIAFALLYRSRMHVGHGRWKKSLLDSMGFHHLTPDAPISLAHYSYRRVSFFDMKLPLEPGLLIDMGDALVFFGAEGTRRAFRSGPGGDILSAAVERMIMWPPRRALRLDLRDGTPCFFAFIDEVSLAENLAHTRALAERFARPT